ncbi:MAG: ECF-type sigma factor [Planctomycetota bacterium]
MESIASGNGSGLRTPDDVATLDIYAKMKQRARKLAAGERKSHTLTPTAIVHEAYLRLLRFGWNPQGGAIFVAAASTAMRRVLVDYERRRGARKRNRGRVVAADPDTLPVPADQPTDNTISELLGYLRGLSAEHAHVFEARVVHGQSIEDIAKTTGLSSRCVHYRLRAAVAWLMARLEAS